MKTWKTFAVGVAALMATSVAQAERWPATRFGLTPETGYLNAVTEDETCNPQTDVLVGRMVNGAPERITKCDGSMIGWITRDVRGRDLSPDEAMDQFFLKKRSGPIEHRAGGADPYDFQIDIGEEMDPWENDTIKIYTCGENRRAELEKVKPVKRSADRKSIFLLLKWAQTKGKKISIELFFNEWVYSGKCIGAITPYK